MTKISANREMYGKRLVQPVIHEVISVSIHEIIEYKSIIEYQSIIIEYQSIIIEYQFIIY